MFVYTLGTSSVCVRNRPEIRLNPVPAGFPASKSGSCSGPVSNGFAGFQPEIEKFQNFQNFSKF